VASQEWKDLIYAVIKKGTFFALWHSV